MVKKISGTQGQFVDLIHSKKELLSFIEKAEGLEMKTDENRMRIRRCNYIVQEYIRDASGVDFRVLCLNENVLGIIKRTNKENFKSNISLGGIAEPIKFDSELELLAKNICKKANLFYAGIDFIKSRDGYMAIEINTSAQFTGFEKATGVNVAKKILEALVILP